ENVLSLLKPFDVLVARGPAGGQTEPPSVIDTDSTWSPSGGPYLVTKELRVTADTTLVVQPGTVVSFGRGGQLLVEGTLQALGEKDRRIVFTSAAREQPSWKGIRVSQKRSDRVSRLAHVTVSNGNLELWDSAASLDDVIVTQADAPGLTIRGNKGRIPTIANSKFERNRSHGIYIDSAGRPVIINSTIRDNTDYAICIEHGYQPASPLSLSGIVAAGNGSGAKDAVDYRETVIAGGMETFGPGLDWVISGGWVLDIRDGAQLTILPGTVLRFGHGNAGLSVHGTLTAIGSAERPIRMTSSGPHRWPGISFGKGSSGSVLRHVVVTHTEWPIRVTDATPRFESITIEDSQHPPSYHQ